MPNKAALVAAVLHAGLPIAQLDPNCVWQPDRDKAAIIALNSVPADAERELGGAIYRNADGEYCYSTPVGNDKHEDLKYRVRTPEGANFDSLYHIHPKVTFGTEDYFSAADVATAEALKKASYLKSMRTGDVSRYDPSLEPVKGLPTYERVRGKPVTTPTTNRVNQ